MFIDSDRIGHHTEPDRSKTQTTTSASTEFAWRKKNPLNFKVEKRISIQSHMQCVLMQTLLWRAKYVAIMQSDCITCVSVSVCVCTLFGYFHFNSVVLLHRCVRSLRIEHIYLIPFHFISFLVVNGYYYIVSAGWSYSSWQIHHAIPCEYSNAVFAVCMANNRALMR